MRSKLIKVYPTLNTFEDFFKRNHKRVIVLHRYSELSRDIIKPASEDYWHDDLDYEFSLTPDTTISSIKKEIVCNINLKIKQERIIFPTTKAQTKAKKSINIRPQQEICSDDIELIINEVKIDRELRLLKFIIIMLVLDYKIFDLKDYLVVQLQIVRIGIDQNQFWVIADVNPENISACGNCSADYIVPIGGTGTGSWYVNETMTNTNWWFI